MSNQKMDGAQALIRTLDDLGIEYIFGYSGGAAIPIFDALETTPFSPPSGPPQRLFHEPPAESKFLAAARMRAPDKERSSSPDDGVFAASTC